MPDHFAVVEDVCFQLLVEGDNHLVMRVANPSAERRTLGVHVQTQSYRGGTGLPFFRQLSPGESHEWPVTFPLRAEPTDLTWVRLRLYALASEQQYDFERYAAERWFRGPRAEPYQPPLEVAAADMPGLLFEEALSGVTAAMRHRRTAHHDIHYQTGSRAAAEIDAIAAERDRGVEEIARWLALPAAPRIRLIFLSDADDKHRQTGHQGRGWAFGRTIVEVNNANRRLEADRVARLEGQPESS